MQTISSRILAGLPALSHREFRRYWLAQSISFVGSWMQSLSLPWVAYTLSAPPFWLGLVSAVQFLPLLLLSLPAGALVDRTNKQRLILISQWSLGGLSLIVALLLGLGLMNYPLLLVFALLFGIFQAIDFPVRQALMVQIVDKEHLPNAVALNSSVFNVARIIGPAIAGLVMATWGPLWCFLINGLSYGPVLIVLTTMAPATPQDPITPGSPQATESIKHSPFRGLGTSIKESLDYVFRTPFLYQVLGNTAIMGIFAVNHPIILPVDLQGIPGGNGRTYGLLISSMGIGSFISAVLLASRGKAPPLTHLLPWFSLGSAIILVILGLATELWLLVGAMVLLGLANVAFFTTANASLQHGSVPEHRGRVMAMYALTFGGLTPLGSLLSGIIMEIASAQVAFIVCAAAIVLGTLSLGFIRRKFPRTYGSPSP